MKLRGSRLVGVVALLAMVCATEVVAQAPWPSRPLRFIVPSSAGGPTDLITRIIGERVQKDLQQAAVIENRPGGGGKIGLRMAAQAPPDGYTCVIGNPGPVAIVQHTETEVGYNTLADFEPVAMLMRVPIELVVRKDLPVGNVAELVAYIRRNPKAVSFGTSGEGQSPHMAAELLRKMIGAPFLIVPYRGAAPAVNDLLGGTVQAMFDTTTALPFVQEGRLRALAVGSRTRSALMPHLPTMAEAGFPGFEISSWYVLLAPAGTPAAIIERLNAVMKAALESREVQDRLARVNAEAIYSTPAGAREYIAGEIANWGNIVRTIRAADAAARSTK